MLLIYRFSPGWQNISIELQWVERYAFGIFTIVSNFGKPFQWQVQDISTVAFSPDGSLLATGSSDLKIRLWNTQSFKMYKPRMKCTKYQHVSSLDFRPNSKI